jgi:hypothetical protein
MMMLMLGLPKFIFLIQTKQREKHQHSKMIQRRPQLLFLLLSLLLPLHVSSFASWLKCYVDLDETEVVMNNQILLPEQALHLVEIEVKFLEGDESEWTTASLTYPDNRPSTVQARLRIPEELEYKDVQYVMETTEGGVFNPAAMCEGSRSHASSRKHVLVLDLSGEQESVELWAGWATGHEAVTMTPRIVLQREGAGATATAADVEL